MAVRGDGTSLVQISLVHVDSERQERCRPPVFETNLRPEQQIIGLHNYWTTDKSWRETVDHHATLWVATRL